MLLSTMRPLAEAKNLVLRFDPPAEDGPLNTDPARFRQVLYNLLSNAIKFTPDGGTVAVRGEWVAALEKDAAPVPEAEATAIRVSVSDTGIGIAPGDQETIWEEFRQVKSSSAEGQQGTGLGLAVTRRVVRLLGGDIWLKSEPGKGSTSTFLLPRRSWVPRRPTLSSSTR